MLQTWQSVKAKSYKHLLLFIGRSIIHTISLRSYPTEYSVIKIITYMAFKGKLLKA